MEQVALENISGHTREKVNESLQCGFTKGKLYPTSLFTFCDKMTRLVNEGRALDLVYFSFNEVDAIHINFSKDSTLSPIIFMHLRWELAVWMGEQLDG